MNDAETSDREERNIFLRILACVLFFVPFYCVTSAIIGGVIGGIAGANASSYAEGAALSKTAAVNFFNKYDLLITCCQVLAYAALCLLRWVPGVSKYKRRKSP
jgi:hypothetical protein